MGFFSGLSGAIGGLFGSQSGSQGTTQQSSSSGYGALPNFAQDALKSLVTSGQNILTAPGASAMYTPLAQTADEKTAENLSQPMTEQGVTDMANMYMNPYQQFLTNAINQNAALGNSNYQNQVSGSGFASGTTNRDFLNEGYATGMQDQAIGTSLANNFNTALTTGLNQQNTNVQQLMGQGANNRAITAGTNQAPISALNALGQILGYIPSTSQSQGTGQNSSQSTDNSGGGFGQALGTVADIASFFI